MRLDVFISEDVTVSPTLRQLLDMDTVFHARDRVRLQRQGICSYVLRALQAWTLKIGRDQVADLYYQGTFGSQIVFAALPFKVEDVDIQIAHRHSLESRHKSVEELARVWQGTIKSMPRTVDIYDLVFVRQLHDSVCVVRHRGDSGGAKGAGYFVLKALTSSLKFMYHELRVLLTMPAHPNIVSTPTRLVTKTTLLNDKRQVVVGFLLPFYAGGGLRDKLPLLRINNLLRIKDQARWATDICAGLLHIQEKADTFYPDLRLDQVVFPADEKRPIILDFEQRGVWCEFGAPEVNAIEYLMQLATDELTAEDDDEEAHEPAAADNTIDSDGLLDSPLGPFPSPHPHYFRNLVKRLTVPTTTGAHQHHQQQRRRRQQQQHHRDPTDDDPYDNPPAGYNPAWTRLTRAEHEFATVYMLGRLLWCVFEGESAPQRGAVWQSYPCEPDLDFPAFRRTPAGPLRSLVARCTRGRRRPLSGLVLRRGSRIVLRDGGDGTPDEIRAVARAFWAREVRWAEEFVLCREKGLADGTWEENHFGRMTLKEVHEALSEFQRSC